MILNLFLSKRKRQLAQSAQNLYQYCVAQARQPELYSTYFIPDTLDGRFDAITLHVCLMIRRLLQCGHPDSPFLQQKLFDAMFTDMERNLREMGAGDLAVPKRIKKMMLAFNGRLHAYAESMGQGRAALIQSLRRNIYRDNPVISVSALEGLYDYLMQEKSSIEKWSFDDFVSIQPFHAKAA